MTLAENPWLDSLCNHRLLINMGKGGVGRSCISAALARLAARSGKRVLVCEVNTKERMSSLLGGKKPENLDTLDQIWQVEENLWTVNIEPWIGMKEYVSQVLRLKLVYNLVFENRVMKYFLRAVPGLQELVYIGKVWYHVMEDTIKQKPRFDLVIVDAPATGHGYAMLRIAQVILDISPPGPMRTTTQKIWDMLTDPEITSIQLITLPEEMPVHEVAELYDRIESQLRFPLGYVWVNQMPPPVCSSSLLHLWKQLSPTGLQDEESWLLWKVGDAVQAQEKRCRQHVQWLEEQVTLPVLQIPWIPLLSHGSEREWIVELAERMAKALEKEMTRVS